MHNINDVGAAYWPDFTFDYSNKYSDPYYFGENLKTRYTVMNVLFQDFNSYWYLRGRIDRGLFGNEFEPKRRSYGDEPNLDAAAVFERNLTSFVTLANSNGIQTLLSFGALLHRAVDNLLKHLSPNLSTASTMTGAVGDDATAIKGDLCG